MTLDPDLVRELARRIEGTRVEFKGSMIEDAKLAKQLCGMANALAINSEPGHVLVGVEQVEADRTGRIVGVDPSTLLNEADYRQKLATYLNRVPEFSLHVVPIDGVTLAVFEVRPGKRPYYAIKESPPLRKPVAYVRDGESVEPATPTQIVDWAHEDGRLAADEAALRARMAIILHEKPGGATVTNEGDHVLLAAHLENLGEHPFHLTEARATWSYTDQMREVAGAALREETGVARVVLGARYSAPGPMGQFAGFNVWVPLPLAIGRAYKAHKLPPSTPVLAYVDATFAVANAAGAEKGGAIRLTFPPWGAWQPAQTQAAPPGSPATPAVP